MIRRLLATTDLVPAATALLADGWTPALAAATDCGATLRLAYLFIRPGGERHELLVDVPADDPVVPTLAHASYPLGRFEREMHDLFGVVPEGHPQPRRLLRHEHWPAGWYPQRADAAPDPAFVTFEGRHPLGEVQGRGVYEIPVGPVHAGLIEPGHFRFSVVGETIVRMRMRLWFLHRGMERLFVGRTPAAGIELAERISGDTAVGHTLAYVLAVEDALGLTVAPEVLARRAVLLELERLHCHIADLGMLGNDVGYGIANVHALRLRERLLRENAEVTGHRLLRGALTVGDTRWRRAPDLALLHDTLAEVRDLAAATTGNGVVANRFTGTAVLPADKARELGTVGYVARASGLSQDARVDHPWCSLPLDPAVEESGDVFARYRVRLREIETSVQLIDHLLAHGTTPARTPMGGGIGVGLVEAWRGRLTTRVELAGGTLQRVKIVDPSWFDWPALPVALADTIVPDFPLANKSFNLSYAGNDL